MRSVALAVSLLVSAQVFASEWSPTILIGSTHLGITTTPDGKRLESITPGLFAEHSSGITLGVYRNSIGEPTPLIGCVSRISDRFSWRISAALYSGRGVLLPTLEYRVNTNLAVGFLPFYRVRTDTYRIKHSRCPIDGRCFEWSGGEFTEKSYRLGMVVTAAWRVSR